MASAWTVIVSGCAQHLAPIPPQPVRQIPLGINAGYHGPLPPDVVGKLCGPITIRTPQTSGAALDAFFDSIRSCWSPTFHAMGFKVLALVEGPDVALAQDFAARPVDAIELGNELELAPSNLTTAQYAAFIKSAHDAIRQVNPTVPIITGGVYTLNDDTKARILAAMKICPDCWVGVHLYEGLSQEDLDWLKALPTKIAVTETGYPTRCDPTREQEQADWISSREAVLSTVPNVALLVIYQWPNGPSCSDLDTFGIADKPAQHLLPK